MRRAGERQFLVGQAEAARRAGLDQRERLQRLRGRARKDRHPASPALFTILPGRIHDYKSAAMAAFHRRAARHFDENRICAHLEPAAISGFPKPKSVIPETPRPLSGIARDWNSPAAIPDAAQGPLRDDIRLEAQPGGANHMRKRKHLGERASPRRGRRRSQARWPCRPAPRGRG